MRGRWAGMSLALVMLATGAATAGEIVGAVEITSKKAVTMRGGAKGFLISTQGTDPADPFENSGRVTCKPAKGERPNIVWILGDGTLQTDEIRPGREDDEPRYIQGSYEMWYHLCGKPRR